jgi:hypothetical protein
LKLRGSEAFQACGTCNPMTSDAQYPSSLSCLPIQESVHQRRPYEEKKKRKKQI